MAGLYVDTSALGRILLTEPDATAIRSTLSRYDRWWSSALLVVELRRLAARAGRETAGEALLAEMECISWIARPWNGPRAYHLPKSDRSTRSTSTPRSRYATQARSKLS